MIHYLQADFQKKYSSLLLMTCLLACLLLTGCATILSKKPQAPIVKIAAVRPLNLSFTKQRLAFTLQVHNPNAYDLPLQSLDFVASLAGNNIATGKSDQAVTLPANGEATVEVEVEAKINKLISHFQSMLSANSINLEYGVKGHVKLANWPTRIPFDVVGEYEPAEVIAPPEKL